MFSRKVIRFVLPVAAAIALFPGTAEAKRGSGRELPPPAAAYNPNDMPPHPCYPSGFCSGDSHRAELLGGVVSNEDRRAEFPDNRRGSAPKSGLKLDCDRKEDTRPGCG